MLEHALEMESVSLSSASSSSSNSSSSFDSSSESDDDSSVSFSNLRRTQQENDEPFIQGSSFPSSIEGAKTRLSMLFDRTNWHTPQGRQYIISLLEKFPALASERFEDPYDEPRFPLALILSADPTLIETQQVYAMYPAAISKSQGTQGDLALHDACWFGAKTDVIRFVAMEYPEALTQKNAAERLPIHDAVRNFEMSAGNMEPSFLGRADTIKFLINAYPGSIAVLDNDSYSVLESAFRYGYSNDLLEFLVEQSPRAMNSFCCPLPQIDQVTAHLVGKLVPKLKKITCDTGTWTTDGFTHLMSNLAGDDVSLEQLVITSFPVNLLIENQSALAAFKTFLKSARVLTLVLVFPKVDNLLENSCNICLRLLGECLQSPGGGSLQRLVLKSMLLDRHHDLNNLLVRAQFPKELELEQISFQRRGAEANRTLPSREIGNGSIETLVFTDCRMHHKCLKNLLRDIRWIPSLKVLKLQIDPSAPGAMQLSHVDFTDPLQNILNNNILEYLELSPLFSFDLGRICPALSKNTSLHTLYSPTTFAQKDSLKILVKILECGNVTLKDCRIQPTGRYDKVRERAIELLRLNKAGRGRIREQSTSLLEFVKIIHAVHSDTSMKLPIDKLNILNGLLRESPSLWCGIESYQ